MPPIAVVDSVWIAVKSGKPMEPRTGVRAIEDTGLEGCRHARPGRKRQLVICDRETLSEFGLEPGQIKENITVSGCDVNRLSAGQQLKLGDEAVVEVVGPCEPCHKMDVIQPGLQAALQGRRGILAKVRTGGLIRPGDAVELVDV